MSDQRNGPPECERPAPPQDRPIHNNTDAADSTEYVAALKRRRATSERLPILDCGRADPWRHDEVPLTDHQIEAWQRTVAHLTAAGFRAIIPADVLEVLR